MRLSKQQKVYGAVLGLALAALVADRTVFSSAPAPADPAESYAATTRSPAAADQAPVLTKTAAPAGKVTETPDDRRAISARLDELARTAGFSAGQAHDAFAAPVAWVGSGPAVADRLSERSAKFAAEHRLTALMDGNARTAVAVVDGRPLRPGRTIDGFTLVSVSAHDGKAVFSAGAGTTPIELRLQKASMTPAAAATVAQAN